MKPPRLLWIALSLFIPPLSAQEPPGPEDFREVAGILSWTFDIHPDTQEDEIYATEWLIPKDDGSLDKAPATGLDFRHVPAGGWVKLYLWVEALYEGKGLNEGGIKFCIQYRERAERNKRTTASFRFQWATLRCSPTCRREQ